jgi:hypothetical protein
MKQCNKCGEVKGFESFHFRKDNNTYRHSCKECIGSYQRNRYQTNPDIRAERIKASRRYNLKQYGITEDTFHNMYDTQSGRCAICSRKIVTASKDTKEVACIDHCHTTGRVRGLLCWDCNVGLGKFFDNTEVMLNAVNYLREAA